MCQSLIQGGCVHSLSQGRCVNSLIQGRFVMLYPIFLFNFISLILGQQQFQQQPQQQSQQQGQPGPALVDETTRWSRCRPTNQTIYDFQVENLNGTYQDLNSYRGQVLLIVNVATFCAYTQQYTDFNPILQQNSQYGMSILAFPCNQFYLQEPAENHEILNGLRYVRPGNGWIPHQNLDIFGKIDVNGDNQHPLYEFLKDSCPPTTNRIGKREELMYDSIKTTDITWNFEKFLIDRQGRPRFRFHPTNWVHGQSVMQFIRPLLNESGGQQQQQQGGSFYQPQMQGQGQQQGQGQFRRQS
uniref:Glutathione peroxidase n=1 Tax=Acrobeloides nanus TaxID=290746 RepID=A0A914C638_9BILA